MKPQTTIRYTDLSNGEKKFLIVDSAEFGRVKRFHERQVRGGDFSINKISPTEEAARYFLGKENPLYRGSKGAEIEKIFNDYSTQINRMDELFTEMRKSRAYEKAIQNAIDNAEYDVDEDTGRGSHYIDEDTLREELEELLLDQLTTDFLAEAMEEAQEALEEAIENGKAEDELRRDYQNSVL